MFLKESEKYFLDTIDAEIRFIGNILSVNTFKTIKSNQMHQMNVICLKNACNNYEKEELIHNQYNTTTNDLTVTAK
ncbi:2532_t:CDS:2 [Entrophospora sp. SA101]|nr:2532_t:CDS:2 [Entrophospora sp. SA101]